MSTKSLMHKRCGTLRKSLFSTRGFAKIHIQRPFFNNKKGIQKIVVLKIQMVSTCLNISNCNYNKFNYILRLIFATALEYGERYVDRFFNMQQNKFKHM
jgi:hypothetical protein